MTAQVRTGAGVPTARRLLLDVSRVTGTGLADGDGEPCSLSESLKLKMDMLVFLLPKFSFFQTFRSYGFITFRISFQIRTLKIATCYP